MEKRTDISSGKNFSEDSKLGTDESDQLLPEDSKEIKGPACHRMTCWFMADISTIDYSPIQYRGNSELLGAVIISLTENLSLYLSTQSC